MALDSTENLYVMLNLTLYFRNKVITREILIYWHSTCDPVNNETRLLFCCHEHFERQRGQRQNGGYR
jgi:hypothetical protein